MSLVITCESDNFDTNNLAGNYDNRLWYLLLNGKEIMNAFRGVVHNFEVAIVGGLMMHFWKMSNSFLSSPSSKSSSSVCMSSR